jgi:hypothetical protein
VYPILRKPWWVSSLAECLASNECLGCNKSHLCFSVTSQKDIFPFLNEIGSLHEFIFCFWAKELLWKAMAASHTKILS